MLKKALVLISILAVPAAFACDMHGNTGFMPENDMQIAVGDKSANDMTEAKFNAIIDKVEKVYKKVVKDKKAILKIKRKWKNNTVNASAQQMWKYWIVNMYGGLARHPDVSADGFAMVVCHELGHHLGGAPKYSGWASNEGQADYFGSMKCFRRVYENDDNVAIISKMEVDQEATDKCNTSFTNEAEVALCIRASMAGKSLAKLLGRGRAVNFKTPDTSVVDQTNNKHPAGQCRLDTYFQGALCTKEWSREVDPKDPTKGVCNRSENYKLGVRPLCWYKPSDS